MAPIGQAAAQCRDAGFVEVEEVDRTAWFAELSQTSVDRLAGPDNARMVDLLGQEEADNWLARARMRTIVAHQGQLRPGHLRARKP